MIIRARKELEFQLVLWATNSHISLAWGHFLLILVNDLVRRWLAWTLVHWAGELYSYVPSKKIYLPQTAARDLSRALSIERQFAFQDKIHASQEENMYLVQRCWSLEGGELKPSKLVWHWPDSQHFHDAEQHYGQHEKKLLFVLKMILH